MRNLGLFENENRMKYLPSILLAVFLVLATSLTFSQTKEKDKKENKTPKEEVKKIKPYREVITKKQKQAKGCLPFTKLVQSGTLKSLTLFITVKLSQ